MTALKNSIVEAAANGVDADPSHIEQLIEAMLSNDGAPAPSESHVLWLRRETTKLIRREINLLSRERIFQQRVDALGVPQDRFGLPLTHNKGAGKGGRGARRRRGRGGKMDGGSGGGATAVTGSTAALSAASSAPTPAPSLPPMVAPPQAASLPVPAMAM